MALRADGNRPTAFSRRSAFENRMRAFEYLELYLNWVTLILNKIEFTVSFKSVLRYKVIYNNSNNN